jgi:hypothetical protein
VPTSSPTSEAPSCGGGSPRNADQGFGLDADGAALDRLGIGWKIGGKRGIGGIAGGSGGFLTSGGGGALPADDLRALPLALAGDEERSTGFGMGPDISPVG